MSGAQSSSVIDSAKSTGTLTNWSSSPEMVSHHVSRHPMNGPYPEGCEIIYFGMGCFWGAEQKMWQTPGVYVTAVGYGGGHTDNPTYHDVCRGDSGHAELVKVVYDPDRIALESLLKLFWESHDPTQGMRQGNDRGSQYRSAIYYTDESTQKAAIETSLKIYQKALEDSGHKPTITTEIKPIKQFTMAEDYHQQYLSKNPGGYCGLKGTGVACPLKRNS